MKKTKFLLFILLGIILVFVYFSFPLIIMPDSTEYYSYLKIFYGIDPISSWNVVRGPILPIILFIITLLFGNTMFGLLLGTFVFYILFLFLYYKIINFIIKELNLSKINIICMWGIFFIFILFNPILFGYFHSLLTEFVAVLIAFVSCLLSWKWININFLTNKRKYIMFNVLFLFLFLFSWFLKQPYFSMAFFPFTIACVISIFKHFNLKNIFQRTLSFSINLLLLILVIIGWSKFLIYNNVDYNKGRNNEYFLSKAIIGGISNFKIHSESDYITIEALLEDNYISINEKKKIISIINNSNKKYNNFKIVNVTTHSGKLIDKMVLYYNGESYSTKDSLFFLFNSIIKHPLIVLDSYYSNYLATINIYVSSRDNLGNYSPIKTYTGFNHENNTIGLAYLTVDNNFLWIQDYHYDKVSNLYTENKASNFSKKTMNLFPKINLLAFKTLFFMLPLLLIYAIFRYIRILKVNNKKLINLYELIIILLGFSFFHVLFHVITGAIIDRYAYIAFPELILGGLLMLVVKNNKKNKIDKTEINNNHKVIFVIPAYNEEKSVEKVIDEVKSEMPEAGIVVINDYSIDKTVEIVKSKGVKCLTLPFNVGYAMAVQTGIKYAFENDYDYVIQFDADGQHIAKEAKKLLNKIKKTECDIVIGSRFLKKNDYKHSFFRKIGTKIFYSMILLFCDKKITDPTSGFQCLNKEVIKRYSKIGKYPEYPDANLIIEMLIEGYKVEEVPVKMRIRKAGKSMHSGIIKPIKYIIKMVYSIIIILIRNVSYKRM